MPVNRLENLKSLRYANADGSFATAFGTLVSGAFLVGFIQRLGGSDLWIGLLTAIPNLVGILQIVGAIWGRGFTSYKRFVFPGGLIWRLMYLPLIALPLLPIPNAAKLTILAVCVLGGSVSTMLVNPIYNDWLAEMVPSNSIGFYFSRRSAILTAVGATVGILGAFVLDMIRTGGQADLGFSLIFASGLLCSAISFFMFSRMQDLPRANPIRQGLRDGIRAIGAPFGDRNYRRVLIFLGVAVAGQTFAGNFYVAFGRETLSLSFVVLVGATTVQALGQVLSAKFWGFLSDKYGNKPALTLAGLALALNPLPWVFCVPGRTAYNEWILVTTSFFMGIAWSGINICQFNIMLTTANVRDRANYIGSGMTVTSILGGISPLLGAVLMTTLRAHEAPEIAYKTVFLVGAAMRIVTVFVLAQVQEEGASGVKKTWRDLRSITPKGYRAMRDLSRTSDATAREHAIQSVGTEGTALASDEIIKALHDPLPRVRRQAASALARLRDPRATYELIHQIEDHPDLLEEETIWSLGVIGDHDAIPALVRTLESPRPLLRRAAANALGRIGSGDDELVIAALNRSAADPNDPDLRRAALQALRLTGSTRSSIVICDALHDPWPSVRIAAAEAASELQIWAAASHLRETIAQFKDEASSESAYALGVVGELTDMPVILLEAKGCDSIITRRRCLLGVACLLGVEQAAYRLLLRDGMDRDAALMELLRPVTRRSPQVSRALEHYAAGREGPALAMLQEATGHEWLAALVAQPVDELFLIAACAVGKK
ncbi:MAG: MFS transporter [Fimbriimonas sp.]|nr:MFS transporter [Fimbriimonas sp.]